jgi:hypothetical protein
MPLWGAKVDRVVPPIDSFSGISSQQTEYRFVSAMIAQYALSGLLMKFMKMKWL